MRAPPRLPASPTPSGALAVDEVNLGATDPAALLPAAAGGTDDAQTQDAAAQVGVTAETAGCADDAASSGGTVGRTVDANGTNAADQGSAASQGAGAAAAAGAPAAAPQPGSGPASAAGAAGSFGGGAAALSPAEQQQIAELKRIDAEVHAHEQAHLAAAGSYARGGAHYEYQRGPDNQQYAVGGEVDVDTSPVPDDPAATISKAQTVRRAALAPARPSGQDRSVAAQASRMESEARAELQQERRTATSPAGTAAQTASGPETASTAPAGASQISAVPQANSAPASQGAFSATTPSAAQQVPANGSGPAVSVSSARLSSATDRTPSTWPATAPQRAVPYSTSGSRVVRPARGRVLDLVA